MSRIDRFFLRVDRLTDLKQTASFVGAVAGLWVSIVAFAACAWLVMR